MFKEFHGFLGGGKGFQRVSEMFRRVSWAFQGVSRGTKRSQRCFKGIPGGLSIAQPTDFACVVYGRELPSLSSPCYYRVRHHRSVGMGTPSGLRRALEGVKGILRESHRVSGGAERSPTVSWGLQGILVGLRGASGDSREF